MKEVTNWEDVGFVIASSYRKKVLQALSKPTTPSSLSKELNINKTHISRTLTELESKKIIICLTPKAKKGKIYSLTKYGNDVLKKLNGF